MAKTYGDFGGFERLLVGEKQSQTNPTKASPRHCWGLMLGIEKT